MLNAPSENLRKNKTHYQKKQKRRQNTPAHAQHRALVFFLEIALYQLLEKELVFFYVLKHNAPHT